MIIVINSFIQDPFNFEPQITSEQLTRELQNDAYPQLQSELLASIFCGGQELSETKGGPFLLPGQIYTIAMHLYKRVLASLIQKAGHSFQGPYYPFLDKGSRDVVGWWKEGQVNCIGELSPLQLS